jgi:hypothetical protein
MACLLSQAMPCKSVAVSPSGMLSRSSFRFHIMLWASETLLRSHGHHWQWEGKNEAAW